MGVTNALSTALSGLEVNQTKLEVAGNNISNVNTFGFKRSRAIFKTQFSKTVSAGSPPVGDMGGTNPNQKGLGTTVGAVQKDFSEGSIQATGVNTDMAIKGDGMFIVDLPEKRIFTRDGTFQLNGENFLTSSGGGFVMGFGVDEQFNTIDGELQRLQIPIGTLTASAATITAKFEGNVNSAGDLSTSATVLESQALADGAAGPAATTATVLTNLFDGATGPLFASGDTLTLDAQKGDRNLDTATLDVVAGVTTLGDLTTFLNQGLGINTDLLIPTPPTPGVTINGAGQLVITGNAGFENRIQFDTDGLTSTNLTFNAPFQLSETAAASGESVFTQFFGYDSLGKRLSINVTMALESTSNTGNTVRFYAESGDDSDLDLVLGTGTLRFDNLGEILDVTGDTVTIDRDASGAITPQQIQLDFSGITAKSSDPSEFVLTNQDGFPVGNLMEFSVGEDGEISGSFTNGLSRKLGQVALATFTNPEGLIAVGQNGFLAGVNSGMPVIVAPETFGAGRIVAGSVELSNVDLSREFVDLIIASTGFSAASRVISTSNNLLDELLALSR